MTLIRNLTGDNIPDDLNRAYKTLAKAYLLHRSGASSRTGNDDSITALDHMVCSTETPVDLRKARVICDLIETDEERPGEIFNNLGHMYVLLQALLILPAEKLACEFCSPTQQSDHDGVRIADLQGPGWCLEAYGGTDIGNNGKLAKDLRTLAANAAKCRTFLAARSHAFPAQVVNSEQENITLRARCSPSHGGPFTASATARRRGISNEVVLLEVTGITIVDGQRTP